jgi:hypothetical protein
MATVPVGVRLDEELVKRIDAIASETGSSRTEIIESCIVIGLKEEENFVGMGPVVLEFANLMLSEPMLSVLEKFVGPADEKALKRFRSLREKRRGKGVRGKPAAE